MVGGDHLHIELNLAPKTHTLLTTSAAGKVYRSEADTCVQTININVEAGAVCEWAPQETILFEDSRFHQQLTVNLGENAIWMGMELFRFGRTARGENFQAGSWRSQTEVWQGDHPLWIDRSVLTGETAHLPNTLGEASVMGTLVVLGQDFTPDAIADIRRTCPIPSPVKFGITRLQRGILCRYLGPSTSEGRTHFLKIWESLRRIYAGRDICIPRVWQI